ncbi:hypothetical protein PENFLA_c007G02546 [Penicillium flavigenum]|uniref:Uncharacterized protein n=1 Tax=Penicillium flavigenum TaxID=254877 RepID=A0A1V6TIH2_9EURO|nr:hypothetical protein PENFLA_c007G02546 [Penicillium flavigenum]
MDDGSSTTQPKILFLCAISKSKISWADEEDALNSVKGDEIRDTKFANHRYIVNQPPISLQPFQGTHLFQHHGKRILFRPSHRVQKSVHTDEGPPNLNDAQLMKLIFEVPEGRILIMTSTSQRISIRYLSDRAE